MNINGLAKGIYYVRVQSNNTVETTKIIKFQSLKARSKFWKRAFFIF